MVEVISPYVSAVSHYRKAMSEFEAASVVIDDHVMEGRRPSEHEFVQEAIARSQLVLARGILLGLERRKSDPRR